MEKRAGLWIDHEEAVIVLLSDHDEETHLVTSQSSESRPGAPAEGRDEAPARRTADDAPGATESRRRRRYYDEVVARLGDAWAVLIFGIGEATREVQARLDGQGRSDRIIGVATAERMTATEIASEVRGRFRA
jgi:hypothetical protein